LSLHRNLVKTISQQFPADLAVFAGTSFDPAVHDRVLHTDGVRAGSDIRFTRATVKEPAAGTVNVSVLDPGTFFSLQGIPWSDGSDRTARRAFERGGAVAVPTSFALRTHVKRGSTLTLVTTAGAKPFRVVGVYLTNDRLAPLLVGLPDAGALLGDGAVSGVGVLALAVDSGHTPAGVKAAIEREFAGRSPVFVRLTSEGKADVIRSQTTFFQLVYALVLIAAVMGMLGMTNTLAMAVLRRNREIGILRAIGTERRHLRRMAIVESGTLALAGLILSVPLGLLLSVTVLRSVASGIGIVVAYQYPWPMFAVVAVLAVAVAMVSSIVPGRHAASVEPARVLRFD
jgi:putative ABC transport system permease protein